MAHQGNWLHFIPGHLCSQPCTDGEL